MTGSTEYLNTPDGLLGRLQTPRRSSTRKRVRDNKTKKWAERSVWSMVCAIELGLIREPSVTLAKKPITRKSALSRCLKESTANKGFVASKSNDSSVSESTVAKNFSLRSPKISKPSRYSSAEKVRNIYYKRGNVMTERKIVFNHFNVVHDCSKNLRVMGNNSEACLMKKNLAYHSDTENLLKKSKSSLIRNTTKARKKIYRKRRYFNREQKTISLQGSVSNIDVSEGKKKIPLARVQPQIKEIVENPKEVFHDDSKTYKLNGDTKNLRINDDSSAGDSSERSLKKSEVFNQRRRKPFRESDEKFEPTKKKKKVYRKRRYFRKSLDKTTSTNTSEVKNTEFDDSEMDETLLVDPSTDLPDTLFVSDYHDNEMVALKPQFDVNFDDIYSKGHATNLDISLNRGDTTEDDEQLVTNRLENDFEDSSKSTNDSSIDVEEIKLKESAVRKTKDSKISRLNARNVEDDYSFEDTREQFVRVTRGSLKNALKETIESCNRTAGTIVWGNCQGWWPGLIINAEDVGMCDNDGKIWIYWIGEHRISNLREKTQIQDFSIGLESRMIEALKTKNSKDPYYIACLETVKVLNDQILQRGPLTKPYHVWVEKHLLSHENIDRLILRPYPSNVQKRIDELQQINLKAMEKYLLETSENLAEKGITRKNIEKCLTTEIDCLPISSQKPGVIAWAKLIGHVWWPAIIIDFRDCGMKEPNFGCQWILWYGDNTLSEVNHRFFLDFVKGITKMKDYTIKCKNEIYKNGVIDAAKDYCSKYGYKTENWTIEDVFDWFEKFNDTEEISKSRNFLPGIVGCETNSSQTYPTRVVAGLRKHKGNCTVAAIRKHNIEDSKDLENVIDGRQMLKDLCLMCLRICSDENNDWRDHPFFEGGLCDECSEKYIPTIFAYGDDGKCFFCTICAGSDTVVMCDEQDCPRVYCTACLKYLVAPRSYDDIMLTDPFLCFLCQDSPNLLRHGLLKPHKDWKNRVIGLFRDNRESVPNQVEYYRDEGKQKMRVLSLFDGISAGLVVLNKLGIQVETYYASEIDQDAEMVSSAHFGEQIIRLGDIRSITEEKIREISPIHLLIGGSPCNDLSLVNPTRLGLHDPNGTGILVFEYRRIKNLIERANGDRHFFWLFENVASMPGKYRLEINKLLGREPDLIDAANYSPQHRPRLYWSNFPIVSYPLSNQDLQDFLTPNCNRHALVKKIQTVTTRVNSLKQGKLSLKPILMNEENDTLWITELEEIFGFPRHYTDVKNLCATKRQKLIGKSWSIQTITELMRPLCNFFLSRDQN